MDCCCFSYTNRPTFPSPTLLNFRGNASSVGRRLCRKKFRPGQLSSNHSKPFLQHNDRFQHLVYQQYSYFQPVRTYKRTITAQAGNQGWDLGRFFRTLYFFNGPPSPAKFIEFVVGKLSNPSPSEPVNAMDSSGIVLVAGATGGVGRRVVNILRNKGLPVRVLVRNKDKARSMLGPDIDLVVGDITKDSTLAPEYFKGVKRVINAVSVIVGPKEGDTPDRAKYSQGIKFFEPEIKGDSPEMVEYIGMKILINAVKASVGVRSGKLIYGYEGNSVKELAWGALDDVVMGGVSESSFQVDPTGGENGGPTGLFKGVVSTANNGGFSSIRTRNFPVPEDLSAYDGLELRLKGDGRRYKLIVRTSSDWDTIGYTLSFDTVEGQWQSVRLPFSSLRPIFRARTVSDAPPFDPSNILSLQLMFSKFEYDGELNPTFVEGAFQLPVSSIRSYIKDPITPRFVHVGSAGVTRTERPGLDLSKQPPAVRLNKELGFILTFKLKGEDLIRESGIPYTIVRPCALTEEPAGADLIFDQGDNITGKISREEVARICVAALESPYACDKTFEVKSVVPFSEPFTVDPENPPPEKDYDVYFKTLKDGITGKEVLEQSPVAV
ncbi:protein HIGH CHLOROPHYLL FLUORESCENCE PHENOTYPE 173, chloroplastic isoform X3 [Rhododendron vialii]|uniref:protein HIGH CHLOROPHYLL FLUORESCENCE PHENOTYPE 173, chloroplastic isoform X3 n=1 Tax=Rhododendron vialii TaxID=182163 RepID=UPI00265F395A|nr:protein HIGH CHLOROPHYLL FLUORESCENCE PHENOTYPE 173, chloroplastic isoform X3 [Rhododendron vialii]